MDKLYAGPMTLPPFESEHGRMLRFPGRDKDPRDEKNEKDKKDERDKKKRRDGDDDCVIVPVPCIIIGAGVNMPGPGAVHA